MCKHCRVVPESSVHEICVWYSYQHVPPHHFHYVPQLLKASNERDKATVTSLLRQGVIPDLGDVVREMCMYMYTYTQCMYMNMFR